MSIDYSIQPEDNPTSQDHLLQPMKLAKNSIFLLTGQIIAQASMALIGLLIARYLGKIGYGQYSLAFAFVSAFGVLFSLGADAIIVRQIGIDPTKQTRIINAAFWLRLLSFPIAFLIIFMAAWIANFRLEEQAIIWLAALYFGISLAADLPRSVFIGIQRMGLEALSRITEKLTALIIVVTLLVVFSVRNLNIIIFGMITSAVLGLILGWLILYFIDPPPRFSHPTESFWLLRLSAPLAWSVIFVSVYTQLPIIILSKVSTILQVGAFNAAYALIVPFNLIPMAVATALLPTISNLIHFEPLMFKRIHRDLILYLLALGVLLAIIIYYLSFELIVLVYGTEFMSSALILKILAINIPIIFISIYLNHTLIAAGAQKFSLLISVINTIMTLLVGFVLITRLDTIGAALTIIIVQLIGVVCMLWFLRPWVKYDLDVRVLGILGATALLFSLNILLIQQSLGFRILLGTILYGLVLILSGVIPISKIYALFMETVKR